jgi:metal-responsive CopG/Arc/MetJ family transcriptional regulator
MPNPLLSVRIPPDLLQQIDTRAAEEGGDRSKVAMV